MNFMALFSNFGSPGGRTLFKGGLQAGLLGWLFWRPIKQAVLAFLLPSLSRAVPIGKFFSQVFDKY